MSTTNSAGKEKYRTDADELDSLLTHKPLTMAQRQANDENYAHKQLAGMRGNLVHLRGIVPDAVIKTILHATGSGINYIQTQQYNRKKARLQAELTAMDAVPAVDEFNPDKWIAKSEGMKS